MFLSIALFFSIFAACNAAASLKAMEKTVSATVKDTSLDGLQGLNIKIKLPFQIDDYIIGIKHTLGGDHKAPEEVFAKKTFTTSLPSSKVLDGKSTIETTYNTKTNIVSASANWVSDKLKSTFSLQGNSKDSVTSVGIDTTVDFEGKTVDVSGTYDFLTKKIFGSAAYNVDDAKVKVSYDTISDDAKLALSYKVDDKNTFTPELSIKHAKVNYKWERKLKGGSVESTLHPGDKLVLVWKDDAEAGVWKTSASIPLENRGATKLSLSRDWKY